MIEKPQILSSKDIDDGLLLQLKVQADLSYFTGHFPAHPVVPGVVQLRWTEILAKQYQLIDGELQRIDRLKFMRVISADYNIELELNVKKDKTLQFQYRSEHGTHASGKMVFK